MTREVELKMYLHRISDLNIIKTLTIETANIVTVAIVTVTRGSNDHDFLTNGQNFEITRFKWSNLVNFDH